MTQEQALNIFRETGVMLEGHFILTSGRHSDRYMQCAHLFQYPQHAASMAQTLTERLLGQSIDLVVSPAVGGIIFGYELARQLNVRNIFAERQDGRMTLRRGFSIQPGERVVVVEDAITTGGSVREVIELVKAAGAEVVAVGAIVDRSGGKVDFGAPLLAAVTMEVTSWEAENCPLCKQGSKAEKPGSRGLK
jgi:orotate phosphoribosyltransferase